MRQTLRALRSAVLAATVLALPAVAAHAATIAAACPPGSLGTFTVTGFAPGDVVLVSGACNVNLVNPARDQRRHARRAGHGHPHRG